jgi:hypothetical protein
MDQGKHGKTLNPGNWSIAKNTNATENRYMELPHTPCDLQTNRAELSLGALATN